MVKLAILGTGVISECHFFALDHIKDVKVTAIASIDEKSGKAACEKFGAKYYGNYKDLLAGEKDFDGLVIALPNHMHYEASIAAIDAGVKAVLCEKPLGINSEQSAKIVEKVRASGIFFQTAYMKRFNPGFRKIKDALGEIGEIEFITSSIYASSPEPAVSAKSPINSWHGDPKLSGGGFLTHSGSHHLDLLRYLFGDIKSVSCKCRYDSNDGRDYYLNGKLFMESGAEIDMRLGRVDVPNLGPGFTLFRGGWNETIEVIAHRGYIKVENPSWQGYEAMKVTHWFKGMPGPTETYYECNEQWINEFVAYVESCKTHKLSPSGSNAEDGYRVDFTIEKMRESGGRNGEIIDLKYQY
jgi:predicted dehydrogenase